MPTSNIYIYIYIKNNLTDNQFGSNILYTPKYIYVF